VLNPQKSKQTSGFSDMRQGLKFLVYLEKSATLFKPIPYYFETTHTLRSKIK